MPARFRSRCRPRADVSGEVWRWFGDTQRRVRPQRLLALVWTPEVFPGRGEARLAAQGPLLGARWAISSPRPPGTEAVAPEMRGSVHPRCRLWGWRRPAFPSRPCSSPRAFAWGWVQGQAGCPLAGQQGSLFQHASCGGDRPLCPFWVPMVTTCHWKIVDGNIPCPLCPGKILSLKLPTLEEQQCHGPRCTEEGADPCPHPRRGPAFRERAAASPAGWPQASHSWSWGQREGGALCRVSTRWTCVLSSRRTAQTGLDRWPGLVSSPRSVSET